MGTQSAIEIRSCRGYFSIALVLLFLLHGVSAYSQESSAKDSLSFKVRFFEDVSTVDLNRANEVNAQTIERFISQLNRIKANKSCMIDGIVIRAGASPDGAFDSNLELSRRRAESIKEFLKQRTSLPDELFTVESVGMDWETLYDIVRDSEFQDRDEVLAILERHSGYIHNRQYSVIGGPKKELMDLNGGRAWNWMYSNVFPEVRYLGNTAVCNYVSIVLPRVDLPSVRFSNDESLTLAQSCTETFEPAEYSGSKSSIFRIGTNLLYDAITVANLNLELGFARHFSFNMPVAFSPWDIRTDLKFRTLLFQPEFRYYFAKDFKGHYLGLEGHCGWYNIALGQKIRYQDRDGNTPLWGAGLSYGFVYPFSEHWGMDFSISAGYAKLVYDCFYNVENGAKFTTSSRDWWGPTKAGISIYYQF